MIPREAILLTPIPSPAPQDALAVSHWVSLQVATRLRTEGVSVQQYPPPPLYRESFSLAFSLGSSSRGVAFFGHGSDDAVFGEDNNPLIDRDNAHILYGTSWFYAYACRAGVELVAHIAQPSTTAAGYEAAIIVNFQPDQLTGELLDAFTQFVTTVPSLLAAGVTDKNDIKSILEDRADSVIALLTKTDEDIPEGIEIALQQLISRLVVRGPSAEE